MKFLVTSIIMIIIISISNGFANMADKEVQIEDTKVLTEWRQCLINEVNKDHNDKNCTGDCSEQVRQERITKINTYNYGYYNSKIFKFKKSGKC